MRFTRLRTVVFCLIAVFMCASCASVLTDPNTITTEEERVAARNQCIVVHTAGGALGGALIGGLIGDLGRVQGSGLQQAEPSGSRTPGENASPSIPP